jgi:hypothetical protein
MELADIDPSTVKKQPPVTTNKKNPSTNNPSNAKVR